MEVTNVNDVKIYSLNNRKSIPEWLTERKRRKVLKRDSELRNRIEFLQDFEMPSFCNKLKMSEDGQYLFATGGYKPRVRCYDTSMLSMKFERCFDSNIVNFQMLSEDYRKLVFLFDDRYVELHGQGGRYYRLRIPKFGHDLTYHPLTCDLYFVCNSNEIIRLNLEQGRFQTPLISTASSYNVCTVAPQHHLFLAGSNVATVEAWDHRAGQQQQMLGQLDIALGLAENGEQPDGIPEITALTMRDDVQLAVGTSSGHILLYDIRARRPYLVKDQQYGLPIKALHFHRATDTVFSQDARILKVWKRETGQPYVFVQSKHDFTDLCVLQDSGLFFASTEDKQMLTYYVPEMGPAPRWCSFLDRMVEEMEEKPQQAIFDDYKFVTVRELEELGLVHLIGTNLLRAYMHGFFVDVKLHQKAKAACDPFAFDRYKQQRVAAEMEEQRADRIRPDSLPKVNRSLAERLADAADQDTFKDDRFKALFENPDFEIDSNLIEPTISSSKRREKDKRNKHHAKYVSRNFRASTE